MQREPIHPLFLVWLGLAFAANVGASFASPGPQLWLGIERICPGQFLLGVGWPGLVVAAFYLGLLRGCVQRWPWARPLLATHVGYILVIQCIHSLPGLAA